MNANRKRITETQTDQIGLLDAKIIQTVSFDDAPAVNIHGMKCHIGIIPAADDEVARGNWWVVLLPKSIDDDVTLRNSWIDQLNNSGSANDVLNSAELIWGSGTFVCSSNGGGFNTTFVPKTSRNVMEGSALRVVACMNSITGLLDEWETNCLTTMFITL